MRKKIAVLMMAALMFSTNYTVAAQPVMVSAAETGVMSANGTRAYYGVTCVGCGRDDCMQYIGYEQVGIGGTLHRMYYKCTNCGGVTFVDLHAR